MKATFLAAALGAAISMPALAHSHVGDCDVESDYSLSIKPDRLVFTRRHSGGPSQIVIAGGTLTIDGKRQNVTAADGDRLRHAEHDVRALVPEVKAIASQAVAIAFSAVGQVAAAFAPNPDRARESAERIARAGREIQHKIDTTDSFDDWRDADVEAVVQSTVDSLVPEIVGNVTAEALKVAFTGDESAAAELQARADSIDKSVDRAVKKQSAELERRAMEICPRLRALERAESELDFRMADGSRLELVHVD